MPETINKLSALVSTAEKMCSAYFFRPPTSASSRRYYERQNSHDVITWTDGGHEYSAAYSVRCSCHNVYASGTYTRDGKKTTLTAIKNSLQRLTAGA